MKIRGKVYHLVSIESTKADATRKKETLNEKLNVRIIPSKRGYMVLARTKQTVINKERAKGEAYQMGYNRGQDVLVSDIKEAMKWLETTDIDEVSGYMTMNYMDAYSQDASYVDYLLPKLRRIAGFEDSFGGTYIDGDEGVEVLYSEVFQRFLDGICAGIESKARRYKKRKKGKCY
jgi:hypothetical protein